ncbi:complex proteins associated with Set1p component shg1-domain-containing protein [Bisporella sp. PMI_857]|nr:complex proteins associated with Set1p component shg1-domain-containing protein [Bisporella sp. PMI_857]KAH8600374.1 complex proteins associated with Set1p component shg1-domain-containing protein [Bisporella sp. PMI_857]
MAATMSYSKDSKVIGAPARKKLKTSDLPLASATRSAIDGLQRTYKKKGGYDSLRQQVWQELERSDFAASFTDALSRIAEEELEKNPEQLLKLDRGKATLLIEGALERSSVYSDAEAQLDRILSEHIPSIEAAVRKHRADEIGHEAAESEQAKGSKTDEQYAEEYARKRDTREKLRMEGRAKAQELIDEKRRADKAKRREEEKRIEEQQERRKEEKEARKREEAEEREKRYKEMRDKQDLERGRDRDRDRDRGDRGRDREREGFGHRDRDNHQDDRHRRYDDEPRLESSRDSRDKSDSKPALSKEESDRLEQEALNNLLDEGKRVAEMSSRQQSGFPVDRSLAPPPRKAIPASAIIPKDSVVNSAEPKSTSFKTPYSSSRHFDDRDRRSSYRSPSDDRPSARKSSRSPSHRHRAVDSDDRRNSRDRRRHDSQERDYRRRRSSKEREERRRTRSPSRDRRKSYRSRSPDRRSRNALPLPRDSRPIEQFKQSEAEKRAEESQAYLAPMKEAKKGIQPPIF